MQLTRHSLGACRAIQASVNMDRRSKRSSRHSTKAATVSAGKISKKKRPHARNLFIHEYAEADSTSSWSAVTSIQLTPVLSHLLKPQRIIYSNNVRQEYELMMTELSSFRPSTVDLRNEIPYQYFLNAVLLIDQYNILLLEKSYHFQHIIHHLKSCHNCNTKMGVCLHHGFRVSQRKSSPVSVPPAHEYAQADSTTSQTTIPRVEISLLSSSSFHFLKPESIHMNNIRYTYEQMLENITLSKPESSELRNKIPYESFLQAVLRTYEYHLLLDGKAFHFQHVVRHVKSCSQCNTMMGTCHQLISQ